jgi:hypothetical protein
MTVKKNNDPEVRNVGAGSGEFSPDAAHGKLNIFSPD